MSTIRVSTQRRGVEELTIIVLAKEPIPGKVKTRLTPAVTPTEAAALARAALSDTFETVLKSRATRRILALDGTPGSWIPAGFEVIPQVSGGLDQRLAGAFAAASGPTILIGMDTPQIRPEDLDINFYSHDAWLGPTLDGGFWIVGMRDPNPDVFIGVPMSTSHTGADQLKRLVDARMNVGMLRRLRDVDTIDDAHNVAGTVPNSRFAMEFEHQQASRGWPADERLFAAALHEGHPLHLVASDGRRVPFNVERWRSAADAADLSLVDRCHGATLDIGCGPGRLTVELARRDSSSLGVDVTQAAVDLTRAAGAPAICRSVFDRLPREGSWDTVLLADGNLGISGNPERLLSRVGQLLRPGGSLLVEPTSHEADEVVSVKMSNGSNAVSREFLWANLGPQAVRRRAVDAGFVHTESWSVDRRQFLAFTR